MRLNDVWRNISQEIGVYWKGQFERVPAASGVYAWFYPLKVATHTLDDFLAELEAVFSFDARLEGSPITQARARFAWRQINIRLHETRRPPTSPDLLRNSWEAIVQDEARFFELRKALLKASILMPPLYVGKTGDLRTRCWQHINGTGGRGFHDRFEQYALAQQLSKRSVRDLIFACIKTADSASATDPTEEEARAIESVVEEILKFVSAPPYGKR